MNPQDYQVPEVKNNFFIPGGCWDQPKYLDEVTEPYPPYRRYRLGERPALPILAKMPIEIGEKKMSDKKHLVEAAAWAATCIAVIVAIVITKSAMPLTAFLIPLLLPTMGKSEEPGIEIEIEKENKGEKS